MFVPKRITFCLDMFASDADRPRSEAVLRGLLDELYRADLAWLKEHADTPQLYQSGVRYHTEPAGRDDWQDIRTTIELRTGDCEDLACWRAAELTFAGDVSRPVLKLQGRLPDGRLLYHITVQHADGSFEDPSAILGMPT